MKKLLFAVLLMFLFSGCATMQEIKNHEVWQHESLYVSFDHMYFSLYGYKKPMTFGTYKQSQREKWWGKEVVF